MAEATSLPSAVRLAACGCLTPFGDAAATWRALVDGRRALAMGPVQGHERADLVPLALFPGDPLWEMIPPRWLKRLPAAFPELANADWGAPRRPVIVTSSNFGVGSLHAFRRSGERGHVDVGTPFGAAEALGRALGWGDNLTLLSHACVSAHLGLLHGTRLLAAGLADEVLVFSFDFLSPFVAGGFRALKILNQDFPTPYQERATGSIGLGDGAGYAVLSRERGALQISEQSLFNEMFHFTANQPDGTGFEACFAPLAERLRGRRVWLKGHGTGTLEAGRLEASTFARLFPGSPLVGWKGSLGHTLGSCGIVELAIAAESLRAGRAPGTVGSAGTTMSAEVALEAFACGEYDGVVCAGNAFGGAHAAFLLSHA